MYRNTMYIDTFYVQRYLPEGDRASHHAPQYRRYSTYTHRIEAAMPHTEDLSPSDVTPSSLEPAGSAPNDTISVGNGCCPPTLPLVNRKYPLNSVCSERSLSIPELPSMRTESGSDEPPHRLGAGSPSYFRTTSGYSVECDIDQRCYEGSANPRLRASVPSPHASPPHCGDISRRDGQIGPDKKDKYYYPPRTPLERRRNASRRNRAR